jgi:hypothetical protein
MDSSSKEKESPKRSSRNRATRADNSAAHRQRASRKIAEEKAPARREVPAHRPIATPSKSRKAPTSFATNKARKNTKRKHQLIFFGLLVLGMGTSAAVGLSDSGQINVEQTIEERNERIRSDQANENDTINSKVELPVQNTEVNSKPDGGLKGRGIGSAPVKPAPVAEAMPDTSTSTNATSSSTKSEELSEDSPVE